MANLLVTGISGFLGHYFAQVAEAKRSFYGFYHRMPVSFSNVVTASVDLTERSELYKQIALIPNLGGVIHLAAASNANFCEENPEISHTINVKASKYLAEYCADQSIPFLFASTDLVFDGLQAPYQPEDIPTPINVYGRHKVEAEEAIRQLYPEAGIVRLPLMYGTGSNFMAGWATKLKANEKVYAFTDEFRTAAFGGDVARGLMHLLENRVSGTWHLGGPERLSRHEFALTMARTFGLSKKLVIPSYQSDVVMPAARPSDVSLDSTKAIGLGYTTRSLEENLASLKTLLI